MSFLAGPFVEAGVAAITDSEVYGAMARDATVIAQNMMGFDDMDVDGNLGRLT